MEYGHRTGNDYSTGGAADDSFNQPRSLPTSYNSRNILFSAGRDFSPNSGLEFSYLRLDQTGLEFPGLVYDLDFLTTDGFELRYVDGSYPKLELRQTTRTLVA